MRQRRNTLFENAALAGLVTVGAFAAGTFALRRRRRINFRGKVILITGGSRGLGIVLARRFALEGARIAICGRDEASLHRAQEEFTSKGADVTAYQCDVASQDGVNKLVSKVVERFGGVDVLVNNAGTITVGPMETMKVADYEQAIQTHFFGPLYMTLAVLPHLRSRGGGRIVNIASVGGKIAVPHLLPYSASKFALVGLSEGMRAELHRENILVTTVCPGLMRTGSPRNASFKGQHRKEYQWFHVADAMPGFGIAAERAARQIIDACRYGRAEIILSLPAKFATTLHALAPGFTAQLTALVNDYALPTPGGVGERAVVGRDSETPLTQSFVTGLSQSAAKANNET